MTNAHNIELSRPNALKNQEIVYSNYALLDIDVQNNIATTLGWAKMQNNITAILSLIKPN